MGTQKVKCDRHGTALTPAYACLHLAGGGKGRGFCIPEHATEPWPDATCDDCASGPEWTDEEALAKIRLLCNHCWEDAYARNTHVPPHASPERWLDRAREKAADRQDRWLERHAIKGHRHFQMELDDERPWLGFGESATKIAIHCDISLIGTWSRRSESWLWGWANPSCETRLTNPLVAMKRYGEMHGLEPLWRSKLSASEDDAFRLAATALEVLPEVEGIYRVPTEDMSVFLAVLDTRLVS